MATTTLDQREMGAETGNGNGHGTGSGLGYPDGMANSSQLD